MQQFILILSILSQDCRALATTTASFMTEQACRQAGENHKKLITTQGVIVYYTCAPRGKTT